jgi:uncharacterized protein YggT (Ycf19 family)
VGAIARTIIDIFFQLLILCMLVRVILSWIPILGPDNPIMRFFTGVTAPLLDPVQKRLPRMVIGMLDLNITIAFIFVWWVLGQLDAFIVSSLPPGW